MDMGIGIGIVMSTAIAFTAQASTPEEEIAARIGKVGSVCIEGEICRSSKSNSRKDAGGDSAGTATADDNAADMVASVSQVGAQIEAKYNKSCVTCHGAGVAGAPKPGDADAWAARMDKGMETLYNSALKGLPPGMPAKGMCFDCSDDELKALVDYMLEGVR